MMTIMSVVFGLHWLEAVVRVVLCHDTRASCFFFSVHITMHDCRVEVGVLLL